MFLRTFASSYLFWIKMNNGLSDLQWYHFTLKLSMGKIRRCSTLKSVKFWKLKLCFWCFKSARRLQKNFYKKLEPFKEKINDIFIIFY